MHGHFNLTFACFLTRMKFSIQSTKRGHQLSCQKNAQKNIMTLQVWVPSAMHHSRKQWPGILVLVTREWSALNQLDYLEIWRSRGACSASFGSGCTTISGRAVNEIPRLSMDSLKTVIWKILFLMLKFKV